MFRAPKRGLRCGARPGSLERVAHTQVGGASDYASLLSSRGFANAGFARVAV